jgi:hypothetical protein
LKFSESRKILKLSVTLNIAIWRLVGGGKAHLSAFVNLSIRFPFPENGALVNLGSVKSGAGLAVKTTKEHEPSERNRTTVFQLIPLQFSGLDNPVHTNNFMELSPS